MRALRSFQQQTWPNRELVIVDDSDAPSFLEPLFVPGIQYLLAASRYSIACKRNLAISRASGEIICHWDDDDWSAPGRIEDQVGRLLSHNAQVTAYNSMPFTDGAEWFQYHGSPDYGIGTSLMYRREFWRAQPFPDIPIEEDNWLVNRCRSHIVSVATLDMMFGTIHAGNTSVKKYRANPKQWEPIARPEALCA